MEEKAQYHTNPYQYLPAEWVFHICMIGCVLILLEKVNYVDLHAQRK